jgi:hypothetical protein
MSEKIKSDPETNNLPPSQLAERMDEERRSSSHSSPENLSTPRATLGEVMEKSTDLVNDNLIAARMAVFSGIALLTAYGISNTPLFFRFRTVAEIPRSYFLGRKSLYGRIISVHHHHLPNNNVLAQEGPESIQIMVRNLSPIGLLLPTSWFEFLMKISPSGRISGGLSNSRTNENHNELLNIRIAGIQSPPISRDSYNPQQFLERLAKQRTLVSCQLLGREVTISNNEEGHKRQMSDILPELNNVRSDNDKSDQTSSALDTTEFPHGAQVVAICKLHYRPSYMQLFATDIAESLVKAGNANVTSSMLQSDKSTTSNTKIVDSSQRINDLQKDVKYLDRLAGVEFDAAKRSAGMWSVPEVRKLKQEVIDEVEFQRKSNVFQKAWRWIRGG